MKELERVKKEIKEIKTVEDRIKVIKLIKYRLTNFELHYLEREKMEKELHELKAKEEAEYKDQNDFLANLLKEEASKELTKEEIIEIENRYQVTDEQREVAKQRAKTRRAANKIKIMKMNEEGHRIMAKLRQVK